MYEPVPMLLQQQPVDAPLDTASATSTPRSRPESLFSPKADTPIITVMLKRKRQKNHLQLSLLSQQQI
jgi:hypothetical protein